ncbi:MAG: cold shock domain-containing protein [candidate division WOR-3 bacterium]
MPVSGRVKWFDAKKGYGFIEPDDGTGDVFVHYGDVVGSSAQSLVSGDRVDFEVGDSPRGRRAMHVRRREV